MATGTALRQITYASVWTRARKMWKEKSHSIYSKEMYALRKCVLLILVIVNANSRLPLHEVS